MNANDGFAIMAYVPSVLFENLRVILDATPRSAAVNMAFDEVLLGSTDVPFLRVYRWQRRAVSFGYFIRCASVPDDGREMVRRMTGGGVVEHGADLTYSLIIPNGHALAAAPPRESYLVIHRAIADWLAIRGIGAILAPAAGPGAAQVCFQSVAESDLLVAGRKIAGAAQRRTKNGLLHQGSVLCGQLAESEHQEFSSAFAEKWTHESVEEDTLKSAADLAARKYALDSWTRRV